jgi:hypothetical protein
MGSIIRVAAKKVIELGTGLAHAIAEIDLCHGKLIKVGEKYTSG